MRTLVVALLGAAFLLPGVAAWAADESTWTGWSAALTFAGAVSGAVGLALTIRSNAFKVLQSDLGTYKEHTETLQRELTDKDSRVRTLEREVLELKAKTDITPLIRQMEQHEECTRQMLRQLSRLVQHVCRGDEL